MHTPRMPADEVRRIRAWHERAYRELREREDEVVEYLGLRLRVPAEVFPPTPVSDLLGRLVLADVRAGDRVLDMGTGSGSNALLAARNSADVLATDIDPAAVACARANVAAHGVADRVRVVQGDLFGAVAGSFDVVVLDPPFRWFEPRSSLEATITDGGYRTLGRFFDEVPSRLRPGGRVLLTFGSSGDLQHLLRLIDGAGFRREDTERRDLVRDGVTVSYHAYRLTLPD